MLWIGPAAALEGPRFADGYGIHVESQEQLDARQFAVRVSTGALQHPVDVRLLLPADYAASPERDYPVLYLFHGTSGRASDWVNAGDAVATTAGLPLIVVMPDAGFDGDGGGWFANWFNGGAYGQPMWETYHIDQLIPWIDDEPSHDSRSATAAPSPGCRRAASGRSATPRAIRTCSRPSRRSRAAARSTAMPRRSRSATAIIQFTTTVLSGVADPDAIFGPRATQELNWQAHDPGDAGDQPPRPARSSCGRATASAGPFDPNPPDPAREPIEVITYGATRLFSGHLSDAGIPHALQLLRRRHAHLAVLGARPPGVRRPVDGALRRSAAGAALDQLHERRRPLSAVGVERGGATSDARLQPPAPRVAGRFALVGTGTASVRTPPLFAPGTRVRVHKRGRFGHTQSLLTVGTSGRLRLSVPLSDDARPRATRVSFRVEP